MLRRGTKSFLPLLAPFPRVALHPCSGDAISQGDGFPESGAPAETELRIAYSRLVGVQLELTERMKQIRSTSGFVLRRETYDQIQRCVDYVQRAFPPPTDDVSSPTATATDSALLSLRRFVEIELSLKRELDVMKRQPHLQLTSETMDHIHQALQKLQNLQTMQAIPRSQETKKRAHEIHTPSTIAQGQKLYSEIAQVQFLAEQKLSEDGHGGEVLSYLVEEYSAFLETHRSQLDMELLISMLQGTIQIAEKGQWRDALINTHQKFVNDILCEMCGCVSSLTPEQLRTFFRWLAFHGAKIKQRGQIKTTLGTLVDRSIDRLRPLLTRVEFPCILSCLRALLLLQHRNCFRILQGLTEHVLEHQERFSHVDVVFVLSYMAKMEFRPRHEVLQILKNRDFSPLQIPINHVARFTDVVARMASPDLYQYMPTCVAALKQYGHALPPPLAIVTLNSFGTELYHPGEDVIEILVECVMNAERQAGYDRFHVRGVDLLLRCSDLNVYPNELIQVAQNDLKKNEGMYPMVKLLRAAYVLSLCEKLDDAILDIVRARIKEYGPRTLRPQDVIFLCRLHLFVCHVLKKESICGPDVVEQYQPGWRPWLEQTMPDASVIPSELVELLQQMGYSYEGRTLLTDDDFPANVLKKDGVCYALEWHTYIRAAHGKKLVLHTTSRWRAAILKALGYGIVRIEQQAWSSLTGNDQKRSCIEEMTSQLGEDSPIAPKFLAEEILASWKTSGAESSTAQDLEAVFHDDVVGGAEFYESDGTGQDYKTASDSESSSASDMNEMTDEMDTEG